MDITKKEQVEEVLKKHNVKVIYHLASLLSAACEKDNESAWHVNLNSIRIFLELSVAHKIKIFWASSVLAFGNSPNEAPQHTVMQPSSFYGITKLSGELLCQYYHSKHALDVRVLRLPGIMSTETLPGAGSTSYSTAMFYGAIQSGKYTCYLGEDSEIPMMFMSDSVQAIIDIMKADGSKLTTRMGYNVCGFSLSPKKLADEIRKRTPLEMDFEIDPIRQKIIDSCPNSLDCSAAKEDWGFTPKVSLSQMVDIMLKRIREKMEQSK